MSASINVSDVVLCDDGAPADFERIYREQSTYVLKLLHRLGVCRAQCEDLAHDVFEVLFLKLPGLPIEERHSVSAMRAFLFRIAWNRVANHRRLRAMRNEQPCDAPPEEPSTPPHDHVLAREMARHLAKLSTSQVAVFIGFEVFGLTAGELAEEHCTDEREVRKILEDARRIIRRSVHPPQEV
jgi:DNA-directed RNA polymerase specialized sigma24 family protein